MTRIMSPQAKINNIKVPGVTIINCEDLQCAKTLWRLGLRPGSL